MPSFAKPPRDPARSLSPRSLPGFQVPAAAGCLALGLCACAVFAPPRSPPVQPEWRLVPEATVLGENRQFFMYGRRLDSVTIKIPPALEMEEGAVSSKGRVKSFHFKVLPLAKDSLAQGEEVGIREVRVKTPDTA